MSQAPAAPSRALSQPEDELTVESRGYLQVAWRRLRRNHAAMVALVILSLICVSAIAAPWISANILHYDPNQGILTQRFQPPGAQHLLGTDEFGRDVTARLITAGRVSLAIGFMVAAFSLGIGVSLGLLAGYYGHWIDDGINALIQLVLNIPGLFLLILLAVLFQPGVFGLALILGLLGWPGDARLVRGRVLSERRRDYVDAALVAGATDVRVMYRHILPNVFSVALVIAGFDIGGAILTEAGLSALGLGIQIPTASWGNMLGSSLQYFDQAWWLVVAPGVMIVLTVLSVYVLADSLRDALDPHLTG